MEEGGKRIKSLLKRRDKESTKNVDISNLTGKEYEDYRLNEIKCNGYKAYPHYFESNYNILNFVSDFGYLGINETACDRKLRITGRIMLKENKFKKLYFYTIEYNECELQILASLNSYSNIDDFNKINGILSRGDYIGVVGFAHRSKRGELSIIPKELILLAPCLNQLPKNIKDVDGNNLAVYTNKESRFRNRHLDWILNPSNRKILKMRSKINSLYS